MVASLFCGLRQRVLLAVAAEKPITEHDSHYSHSTAIFIIMSLLNGLLILLLFQCLGEALKTWLNLNLPGPVLGMLLLFFGLCLYRDIPPSVAKSSQTLIPMLALMFLPASVGLFFLGAQFDDQWPAIIGAIVIGSLLSLTFNGLIMKWLCKHRRG